MGKLEKAEKVLESIKVYLILFLFNYSKTILLVTHGGVLMSFIHKALNISLIQKRTYSLFNGSINTFTLSGDADWKLEVWGDVCHLKAKGIAYLDDN